MSNKTIQLLSYGLFALAAAIAAWMYTRAQSQLLWGYAPLLLYVSLYAGGFLLATYRKDGTVIKRNLLSGCAGLLLGLGFPGLVPFPFLLLVALVPLILLQLELQEAKAPVKTVFFHGFSAFVLYNLLATYWVTNTGFFAGLFAVLVNSLLMCIPWLFYYWTARRSPSIGYLGFAAAWLSFELLHYNWSLNWPWLTLGNGFMQFPELVQWYEWTGIFGGTAWILAANYLGAKVVDGLFGKILSSSPGAHKRPLLLMAFTVILPISASLVRYFAYQSPGYEQVSVAAIQPNFEPHFEKFSGNQAAQLDTFLRLSKAALDEGSVDYLIYPETSFSRIDEDRVDDAIATKALRDNLTGKGARYLITGIDAYHIFADGEPYTEAVRFFDRGRNGTIALEAINGAAQLALDSTQTPTQTYRKGVFVPGAESFPFKDVLFFMEPFVNSLGGTVAGRGTQATRDPFTSETAAIAPVICYESVFGEYFTGYVKEGAQAAFVVTNDGWWDNTAGHRQHLWLSSLRAIETRRAVVRSANMGACAFIDQRGHVQSRTSYGEEGHLRGEITLNDELTLYVRYGDIIARIGVLVFLMVLLANVARTIRPAAFEKDEA
ncbi:apolipoprotein N-acyltransferase [Lewinella sp. 4G2]|uniref:apolipoprotein N-acyltransferase n=1 Tax=Lewinella sp. 4G2 TaxID=1803372 RepID=UPI0007B47708|nr:apolipoprotein N-acyltransferase [Lewinella sp. 4G2]OAV43263.1 apolipoprotein N-acyltransferase [Lewinella sp. 4G2]